MVTVINIMQRYTRIYTYVAYIIGCYINSTNAAYLYLIDIEYFTGKATQISPMRAVFTSPRSSVMVLKSWASTSASP